MKYVKITAENYNKALSELREKYGEDAIPISHKYIKQGGLFNSRLFSKDICELTAGINEKKYSRQSPVRQSLNLVADADNTKSILARQADEALPPKSSYAATLDLLRQVQEKKAVLDKPEPVRESRQVSSNENEVKVPADVEKELTELKSAISKLSNGKTSEPVMKLEEELIPYKEILSGNDFTEEEAWKMLREVKNSLSRDDLRDKFKIEKNLKDLLKSKIIVSGPIKIGHKKKVVIFAGPTGVGKTTSLAKLGALLALKEQKRVAFVTIDTYRIAATEQLKKYAEIMKIPIYVVSDQKEFKQIIDKEKAEVLLVDTSGRSHKNTLKISELKSYADQVDVELEKILCVSAATKKRDLMDILKAYEPLEVDNILITKVDETSYVGNIVDVADKYNKPISYVANGQEVPNDIFVANGEKLLNMMISGITD
ncbi:MAG TPA: flagellar biosynthesis protein FlhF [Spirochaetota bacterium]|jgi:flagellar biosynthesis protein FlhF|nr:flagellar biosynthesis protein FlhF [Spirochaetota bacterium]HOH37795.1 flagellar biosynthesis protein FlhF [Spirochaetota bacterium]HPJ14126.1 flagellar biosynthesis protein FlhF [Spirochaetota bacterium]HPM34476.1 flagellar biosynthesis protein FlhF [Spirochaetota bacterium]HPY02623.1 flagellar biosynthesis protein FlhF [Spirochaetota bacterium]